MKDKTKKELIYQDNFSSEYDGFMYNKEKLIKKSKKTVSVLKDFFGTLNDKCLLDLGCSTGIMTNYYSKYFKESTGIDIDKEAIVYAEKNNGENAKYVLQNGDETNFPADTFDVITCTQIYEHVPDSKKLLDEIYRLLKPGGVCYFSAGNRINIMEPHHKLPFLSILPKSLANYYLYLFRGKRYYYENHLTYFGLKKLVKKFHIIDYTLKIVQDPLKYEAEDMIKPNSITSYLASLVAKNLYFLFPTYIWLLKK